MTDSASWMFTIFAWMWGLLTGLIAVISIGVFRQTLQTSVIIGGVLSFLIIVSVTSYEMHLVSVEERKRREVTRVD